MFESRGARRGVAELTTADLAAFVATLGAASPAVTEAENIDRIRLLEELKAVCAGAQAEEAVALENNRRESEAARGVPAHRRGRGLGDEIALARRESPWRGSRFLSAARTLATDLPNTLAALKSGILSEERAMLVTREVAALRSDERREVDDRLAPRLGQLGNRGLVAEARSHVQAVDPRSAEDRARAAVKDRYVTITAASESMVQLSALLPAVQGRAAWRALGAAATAVINSGHAGERTRAQITADRLVELLTGQETAQAVPVELHLVMTDTALIGTGNETSSDTPAWIVGHGPIPAGIARELIDPANDGPGGRARVWLRRLYTAPDTGQLVGMDSKRRLFDGMLRRMVILRDDTCRTPWCDAPIRHIDHAKGHASGGETSYSNASGLCERGNHSKEEAGWSHTATADSLTITTPTGHVYRSETPPIVRGHPFGERRQSDLEHSFTRWIYLNWWARAG